MTNRKEDGLTHNGTSHKNHPAKMKNSAIIGALSLILLLAADQLTKLLAYRTLKFDGPLILIPGVFELRYLQNEGAAFGMMKNMQWIFILFALIITGAAVYFYFQLPSDRRFLPLRILCVTLSAGALGNMIDRLVHHYVIDFLYFTLIDFPIFNVADIYVCLSTVVFLLLLFFYYKEDDFLQLQGKKTKQEYVSDIIDKIQESKQNENSKKK